MNTEEYKRFLTTYYLDYNILSSIVSFFDNPDIEQYKSAFSLWTIISNFYDLKKFVFHIWRLIYGILCKAPKTT